MIVTFNSRWDIIRCLKAVYASCSGHGCEVVIVDNASTDGTAELLATTYPDVRVLRNDNNVGFGAACNRGTCAGADADYILYLNPDCILNRDAIEALVRILERERTVGAVGPGLRTQEGLAELSPAPEPDLLTLLGQLWGGAAITKWRFSQRLLSLVPGSSVPASVRAYVMRGSNEGQRSGPVRGFLSGACLVVRSEALAEIGGFDPAFLLYYEDADLCARLRRRGYFIWYEGSATVIHATSASSGGRFRRYHPVAYESGIRYLSRHRGRAKALIGRVLVAGSALVRLAATALLATVRGDLWRDARDLLRLAAWAWGFKPARLGQIRRVK